MLTESAIAMTSPAPTLVPLWVAVEAAMVWAASS
jgi:hypothetical protein